MPEEIKDPKRLKEIEDIKKERQEEIDNMPISEPAPSAQPSLPISPENSGQINPSEPVIKKEKESDINEYNKLIEEASKFMLDASLDMEKSIISLEKIFIKMGVPEKSLKDSLSELYSFKIKIKEMSDAISKHKRN